MNAEIVTIGDEILIGQIVDTNSAWLGEHLNYIGVQVTRITSVQDNKEEIKTIFDQALSRADLVIVTGGLGPTKDDITKNTLSEYFNSPLVLHNPTSEFVKKMIEARGGDFNSLNRQQAYVPECCTVIHNPNGTAPGMWFDTNGKVLVSLPGVPFEMKNIFIDTLGSLIKSHFALKSIVHKTAITFGIPESTLALKIEDWEDDLPSYIKLAYLPNAGQIRLRLSAYEVDEKDITKEIESRFETLREIIPNNFLGFTGFSLERVVADMLLERGETISVAESCSGGAIAAAFTAMAGASAYFRAGVVAYSNDAKRDILGVNPDDLDRYGAVSQQVAEQMAQGVRKITSSTFSIATTGVAGPGGGSPDKPVGTIWIAIATPKGVYSMKKSFGNVREENIKRTVANAINLLREKMLTDF